MRVEWDAYMFIYEEEHSESKDNSKTVYFSGLYRDSVNGAGGDVISCCPSPDIGRLTPDGCAQKRGFLPTITIIEDVRSSFALQGPSSQIETIANDQRSDSHSRLGSQHTLDFQSQPEEGRAWVPRACFWD